MQKLADISVFEGLQATQNAKFGLSSMSAFNEVHNTRVWNKPYFYILDANGTRIHVDLCIEHYPYFKRIKDELTWDYSPEFNKGAIGFYGVIPHSCTKFSDKGFEGDVLYSTGKDNEVAVASKESLGSLLDGKQSLPTGWDTKVIVA